MPKSAFLKLVSPKIINTSPSKTPKTYLRSLIKGYNDRQISNEKPNK